MKQKVIVVGIGFTSRLGIIRSLGELGYEVQVIVVAENKKPIDCYSKYVSKFYFFHGNNGDLIIQILLDKCVDEHQKPVIIPVNDFSASVIDNHLNELSKHFFIPNIRNQQGLIAEWMNKEKQKALANRIGLSTVNSKNIIITNHTYKIPEDIKYPCFTKTRAYVSGYKGTIYKCNNEKDLQLTLNNLSNKFEELVLMVEDYKEIEKEYAVVGFSNGNEVIIPGVIEIMSMAEGGVKGVACQGRIMEVGEFSDLVDKFSKFIKEIGFYGLFDIDFFLCKGIYYFGELNLRIGGSGSAVMKMGVNLPAMLVKSFLGESIEGMKKSITNSSVYINERICMDNCYHRQMTTKRFIRLIKSSDISFVDDKNDPAPKKVYQKQLALLLIKRTIKRWISIIK